MALDKEPDILFSYFSLDTLTKEQKRTKEDKTLRHVDVILR